MAQMTEYLAEYQELLRLAGKEGAYVPAAPGGPSGTPIPEEHQVDFSAPSGLTPTTLFFTGNFL